MRVGLAQLRPHLGSVEENVQIHLDWIRQAKQQQVDLLVFPELSVTGYQLLDLTYDVARTINSDEIQTLISHAEGLDVVFGWVESSPEHLLYNSAIYASNQQIRSCHRKVYLPTYGLFDEARYFTQGDRFQTFSTPLGRVGLLICEDLWHSPTSFLLAMDSADILIVLANSPSQSIDGKGLGSERRWQQLLSHHAQSYGTYVLFSHRIGSEDGLTFFGGSSVVNPYGEVEGKAARFTEELLVVDLDLDQIRLARYESPLLGIENFDFLIRELKRIQQRRLRRGEHAGKTTE